MGTPIEYDRLLQIAKKMHTWIYIHSFDEQAAYDELGLTDEENEILGYSGVYVVELEPPDSGEK